MYRIGSVVHKLMCSVNYRMHVCGKLHIEYTQLCAIMKYDVQCDGRLCKDSTCSWFWMVDNL